MSTTKSLSKSFLAGCFSGTCSTLLFQPLDLVKTRIQNPIAVMNGSSSMINVMVSVVRHDSLKGLWQGVTPSIIRTVPGVGLYFSSMHLMSNNLVDGKPTAIQSMAIGVASRSITCWVMLPFTVVKTRIESGQFKYTGVLDALRQIGIHEGPRGLYSGVGATLLRDAPFSGLYLMFYNKLKQRAEIDVPSEMKGAHVPFICGMIAGTLASTVTQPADVIKTSMQLDSNKFRSVVTTIVFIYQKYGSTGFFRGLVPRTCRRTLMAAMAWTIYEQALTTLHLK